jgi:hypothetical protein
MIAGAFGVAVHALTATDDNNANFGGTRKVLHYRRPARLAAVAGAATAVILWAASAAYELPSELRIAAATLPGPEGRLVELTLVNQGQRTHVLREFQVESRTMIPFPCLSAEFDIPVAAEYELPFHIAQPLTEIAADPPKQFQAQAAGRVRLGLKPDATGACVDEWDATVRVFVVSDDDKRAGTAWFKLRKVTTERLRPNKAMEPDAK